MASFQYILDGHDPVPVDLDDAAAMRDWAGWCFGPNAQVNRCVALDKIGDVTVSTVFVGYDQSVPLAEPPTPPLGFETMIFRGDESGDLFGRWRTWAEAEEQHASALRMVLKDQPP